MSDLSSGSRWPAPVTITSTDEPQDIVPEDLQARYDRLDKEIERIYDIQRTDDSFDSQLELLLDLHLECARLATLLGNESNVQSHGVSIINVARRLGQTSTREDTINTIAAVLEATQGSSIQTQFSILTHATYHSITAFETGGGFDAECTRLLIEAISAVAQELERQSGGQFKMQESWGSAISVEDPLDAAAISQKCGALFTVGTLVESYGPGYTAQQAAGIVNFVGEARKAILARIYSKPDFDNLVSESGDRQGQVLQHFIELGADAGLDLVKFGRRTGDNSIVDLGKEMILEGANAAAHSRSGRGLSLEHAVRYFAQGSIKDKLFARRIESAIATEPTLPVLTPELAQPSVDRGITFLELTRGV